MTSHHPLIMGWGVVSLDLDFYTVTLQSVKQSIDSEIFGKCLFSCVPNPLERSVRSALSLQPPNVETHLTLGGGGING